MALWDTWVNFIINVISILSWQPGISEAVAIILFTLCIRLLLFPVSYRSAYNMYLNRQALEEIRPRIEKLRQRYRDDPAEFFRRQGKLYRDNDIKMMDRVSVYNMGLQGVVGIGTYQALRQLPFTSKFLWISNIAKPDFILAILVGLLTVGMMLMSPGTSDQVPIIITMMVISTVILLSVPSVVGIYWATSTVVSIIQTIILRRVTGKRAIL